jgi:integrase
VHIPTSHPPSITTTSTLPTLAAALVAIDGWTDLPPPRRASLKASLQTVADMLGDPPSLIVLTPSFVRARLLLLPPSAFGISEGTMRNHRSAIRRVMERLGVIDACDAPQSAAWRALLDPLDSREKAALAKLADFCALRRIEPDQLTNEIFAEYLAWLEARTIVARPKRLAGSCRRAWNSFANKLAGWPAIPLTAPSDAHQYILPLNAFTQAFQADLARFGARLGARTSPFRQQPPKSATSFTNERDETRRPTERGPGLRPISVQVRLGHVRWAASALVASGSVPVAAITAVTDLVQPPDRAHDIMNYLFELRGRKPWPGAMHVLEVLLMLAKYEAKLPEEEIDALRGWRRDVAPGSTGMSPRRRDRIRAVMEPERLLLLLQLPGTSMEQALALLPAAPRDATSLAMRALAVQLLLTTQIRLRNLIEMKLGAHLQSNDPARRRYQRLDIAAADTKNTNPILRPIGAATRAMLDLWVRHFRPTLASDADGYLFPGHGTPHIGRQGMRDAVKAITGQVVGVALTPHDFRGIAAKIHLHFNPGDYGTVMHLLGHGLETTMGAYTVDEAERAAADFDRTILRLSRGELDLTKPPGRAATKATRAPLVTPGRKPGRRPRGPRGRS